MDTKYTGKPCVHCKKLFTDGDDIVVCPTCGAPHHRSCYKELGHCAREEEHQKGKKWNAASNWGAEHEEIIDGNAPLRCQRCGTMCRPQTKNCPVCGASLHREKWGGDMPPWTEEQLRALKRDLFPDSEKDQDPGHEEPGSSTEGQREWKEETDRRNVQERARARYDNPYSTRQNEGGSRGAGGNGWAPSGTTGAPGREIPPIPLNPLTTPYGGVGPEEKIEGIPVQEMVMYIGPNSHYYLPRFKMLAGKIGKAQWNWSAFFFHFIYFFYRKMYLVGALFFAAYLMIQLPLFLVLPDYISYLYETLTSSSMFTVMPASVQWYMNYSYISNFILLALGMLASLTANRFYFKKVCKEVRTIREEMIGSEEDKTPADASAPQVKNLMFQAYFAELYQKGRVNIKIVIILLACVMFINFGLPSLAVFWMIQ